MKGSRAASHAIGRAAKAAVSGAIRDAVEGARLGGVYTALATPMKGGKVDGASLRRLVEQQVAAGVASLCPCGTTGESPTISEDEHREIVEIVVEAAAGRALVAPGTSSNDTRHAVALTKQAQAAGAHASLAVSPYYNRPTQEGLYRHFQAMYDEGGLPLILYHIPGRTGGSIEIETIARLHKTGAAFALKEAGGNVDRVTRIREACGITILSGDDALTLPFLSLGATGVVSVASNVVPAEVVGLVRDFLAGRVAEALAAHDRLAPLVRALFLETNPIPVKAALRLLGVFASDEIRLPLTPASPAVKAALEKALEGIAVVRAAAVR